MMPTVTETETDADDRRQRRLGRPAEPARRTRSEPVRPTTMPRPPPSRQSTTASTRNCRRMSLGPGADGHPQADLAVPLGHRHEHDVHDADAADDQRDQGHAHQQARHEADRRAQGLDDLGHVADVEVVRLARADVVPLAQQLGDLRDRDGDLLGRSGRERGSGRRSRTAPAGACRPSGPPTASGRGGSSSRG